MLAELDLLDHDDRRISVASLARQAVTAVVVAVLGLVVVGAVSATSAPYSTAVAKEQTTVSGATDITRAQPQPAVNDEAAANAVSADQVSADELADADLSRSALRSELSKAVTGQISSARDEALKNQNEQVEQAAQSAAADQRAASITNTSSAISTEQKRQADEAARVAAEKAVAELVAQSTGTLVSKNGTKSATTDPKLEAALATISSSSGWVTPLVPGTYTRGAGWGAVGSWARYHTGVDLVAAYGTPIRAAGPGVVMPSDGGGWAGIHVVIKHAGGGQTLYAHMSAKTVQPGQIVKAGQIIGYVGLTGRTFGPHCHFEYYPPGARVGDVYTTADPASFLLRFGVRL